MMAQPRGGHSEVLSRFVDEMREILDQSSQGIYVYLDDSHKACNERFAEMLGYHSAAA